MPKLKSNRGAAKRFKKSGSGKFMRHKAFHSHILTKKTRKRKRNLRKGVAASPGDSGHLKQMLPYL